MINRQELRERERRKKKLQSWLKSFNSDQKMLWESTILSEIEKNDRTTMMIIDKCYMASIANNIEVDIIDLEKIINKTSQYMQDYKDKIEKGDVITMLKSAEKPIQTKIRSFVKAKKDKVESIKELEKEYNIPFAELDVMWLSVKQTMGIMNKHAPKPKNVAEEEIKEVLEETKPVLVRKKEVETVKNETNDEFVTRIVEEGQKGRYIDIKDAVEELGTVEAKFVNPNKPKLKVLNTIQEIQGVNGDIYIKSVEGVRLGATTYKDIEGIKAEKQAVKDELEIQNQELQKGLIEINKKIKEAAELRVKELEKYEEIEEVFKM